MKALVVGARGLVGTALMKQLNESSVSSPVGTVRRPDSATVGNYLVLDLAKPETFAGVLRAFNYEVMYLVAAVTKVVDCEAEPQKTWRVNADAPVDLALRAFNRAVPARVVFISSDAVERAPNLNYSRQKAYVESVVLARGGVVVRPSRIVSEKLDSLIGLLLTLGRDGQGLYRWPK